MSDNLPPYSSNRIADAQKLFEPIAHAIGFFVSDWNWMQNSMMELFCSVLGITRKRTRAMWHAIPVDRHQRAMLKALAEFVYEKEKGHNPADASEEKELLKEIRWLVDSADKLGDGRDNIVHSPLALVIDEPLKFLPLAMIGHPRAMKLMERMTEKEHNIEEEITLYRARTRSIALHASQLRVFLEAKKAGTQPPPTFPKRPAWPDGADHKRGESQSRATPATRPTHQPLSSQE